MFPMHLYRVWGKASHKYFCLLTPPFACGLSHLTRTNYTPLEMQRMELRLQNSLDWLRR
jgi:hypothetical protein